MSPPALRAAIAQVPMHWELSANVLTMKRAMAVAKADGAYLVAFAELAVTGFHRRIAEWAKPQIVGPAVVELQHTAAALGIAVAFGAPTFAPDGERFNSHLFVAASGALVGAVSKSGLTDPEATFFKRANSRPVVHLGETVCSAVICREIEDHTHVVEQLTNTGVQLLFWPGQMRPDPTKPVQDPPEHVAQAQSLAVATGAYIVQTNWPNALNRPEESENTGHSACIAPTGELLFRLPMQGFGIGVFTLGERTYSWHPCAA